jgi:hypothetical protein
MSVVTNLILTFSSLENEDIVVEKVNSFHYRDRQLDLVSADYNKSFDSGAWYGGDKFLEARVYIGAFNHFDIDRFIIHLKQIKWASPENVQIMVKGQDDEKFKILELT